jgi:hypothetical protein
MKPLFALFFTFLALTGCQHDTGVIKELKGNWKWKETEGAGIAGPYHQTASAENAIYLDFFETGKLRIKRTTNGEVFNEEFTYHIGFENNRTVISLFSGDHLVRKEFIEVHRDTLKLSNYEPCCDNTYLSTYERNQELLD